MADIIVNVQPVFDDIITQETTVNSLCDVDAVFDGVDIDITITFSGGGGGGTFDHTDLINLAFDDSGHSGFERAGAAAQALTDAKTYTDTELLTKQDSLVSGTNIKTINNASLLGAGNITIEGETDHSQLSNLDYANSGHTGFEESGAAAGLVGAHESTYNHGNIPTTDEKQALTGTTGTPSILNKYVTNDDPRLIPATTNQYRTLYMSNIPTSIDGYLLLTAEYNQLQETPVTIATTTSAVDELIGGWTIGQFNQGYRVIPVGVWKYYFRGRVQTALGKKSASVIAKLYKRNTLGEETFLLESLTSPVLTDTFQFLKVETPVTEFSLENDEILVGKLYARSSGNGGEPTVEYQYTGQTGTRIEVPSTGIVRHSDTTERDEAGSHTASAITVDATLFVDTELTTSQKIAKAVDDLKASGFTKIVASDTEPLSQPVNTIWINTITFNFYVLYSDGDSSQWVGFPGNTTGVSSKNYWEGTQAQYDALGVYNDNTLYFITT